MKRIAKFITIPLSLWTSADLTIAEKFVLVNIDSVCESADGVALGATAIASLCGMPSKDVKDALKGLYEKGALDVNVDEDGLKKLKPLLYKDRYVPTGEKIVIGDKPTDVENYDYDEISAQWAKYCPMLPAIARWTPQRKRKLRSSMKGADLSLADLYKVFMIIGSTPFLNGSTNQFKATYDWVTSKSQNLQKIYEGFYSKSYAEKKDYEAIMRGQDVAKVSNKDSIYR